VQAREVLVSTVVDHSTLADLDHPRERVAQRRQLLGPQQLNVLSLPQLLSRRGSEDGGVVGR
jgi:hypothetical protein